MRYSIQQTETGSYGFWDHEKDRWLLEGLTWDDVREGSYWVNIAEQQKKDKDGAAQ